MTDDSWDDELDIYMRETYEDLTAFYDELEGESARAAAILAVAQIDHELTEIIKRYFPADVDKKVWIQLFGPGAPNGNLKNKCLMAEALGAFGPQTRKTIEKMGEIRNKFAHETDVRMFTHPKVLSKCKALGDNPVLLDTASESDVRRHFITTAKAFIID